MSWFVDFQWGLCGSIFSFLCHGWQTFSVVRVAQSLVFCVMVGRLLVGFVWLNLQFSVSWLVDLQWGSCGSIFSFLCQGWQLLVGSCGSIFSFLSDGWQTFRGVRVAQSLAFYVMVRILLVRFVCLNLQFSASWLGDFQWGSCGSNFCFLCHGRQTFSGVRVAQSLVFCVMVGRLLVEFVRLNLQFSGSRLATFSGVRVAQSLLFCLIVGRLLVGSCGSIFRFLCHDWWTFNVVRVAQTFVFCVMVGRPLVGFVCLNLQFPVSRLVDFQWASCGSIFRFLCHGRQIFSGVHVAQSLVFCGMVGRFLIGYVWLNLVFCVMVGRLLGGFVWLNLQVSVSQQVDFQWGSCGSIFSFMCHGRQIFSGVRVAQSLVLCVMVGRFLVGFVWLNLVFCVMVGRLLGGFVWLNLQVSVSQQVDFQWGSCSSIFSFLCYGRQNFSGVRVAQSLIFFFMVGILLVGFVWLKLQISVSWQVDFQWGSCGSIFSFLWHGRQIFNWVRVAQSSFLCHGWQTFSGVRVAQSLVFCVTVGRLLVGFVWLNLQFYVSWQVDFQWGSCGSIFSFMCHGRQIFSGVRVAQSSFLCHGWQTFRGVRVAQSLGFCIIVGRLLVGFVWLNLQFSVLWQAEFQWGSCGSIFNFLFHGWYTFSWIRVAQTLVFYVMVGRLSVGFVWFNLQFSVSWLVDFQWGSCGSIFSFVSWLADFQWGQCGSIFSFLCHG